MNNNFLTWQFYLWKFHLFCVMQIHASSKLQIAITVLLLDLLEKEASVCSLNSFSEVHALVVVCGITLQFNF